MTIFQSSTSFGGAVQKISIGPGYYDDSNEWIPIAKGALLRYKSEVVECQDRPAIPYEVLRPTMIFDRGTVFFIFDKASAFLVLGNSPEDSDKAFGLLTDYKKLEERILNQDPSEYLAEWSDHWHSARSALYLLHDYMKPLTENFVLHLESRKACLIDSLEEKTDPKVYKKAMKLLSKEENLTLGTHEQLKPYALGLGRPGCPVIPFDVPKHTFSLISDDIRVTIL